MAFPGKPEDKAQLDSMFLALKPQSFVIEGSIANVGAGGSIPTMVPGIPTPILLPTAFVNSVTAALRAQREFNDKLFNIVEFMYQKMNE